MSRATWQIISYRAQGVTEWFDTNDQVNLMLWPSQLPDLTPIGDFEPVYKEALSTTIIKTSKEEYLFWKIMFILSVVFQGLMSNAKMTNTSLTPHFFWVFPFIYHPSVCQLVCIYNWLSKNSVTVNKKKTLILITKLLCRKIWDAYGAIGEILYYMNINSAKVQVSPPVLSSEDYHINLSAFHYFSHWSMQKMNIVRIDPGTSLLKLPILWTSPPCFPNSPSLAHMPAQLAALHFTLICECEFYQTSIFSFESYPNGHFIVLQARTSSLFNVVSFLALPDHLLFPLYFKRKIRTLLPFSWPRQHNLWAEDFFFFVVVVLKCNLDV